MVPEHLHEQCADPEYTPGVMAVELARYRALAQFVSNRACDAPVPHVLGGGAHGGRGREMPGGEAVAELPKGGQRKADAGQDRAGLAQALERPMSLVHQSLQRTVFRCAVAGSRLPMPIRTPIAEGARR